ncbi:MAG: DNA polymerase III subunit gamma/tau [Ruminococcus sp.]|nr:DNA polymerase III subunit gamma/tau [Ruminococcus sp.]MCM1382263.1 DNA polymerase III subunit gamma/tau [Muribaculaceae bacterium]MCM1480502.1 DNA polymerase III subunit gamma/tau [Muribaculaceae bacterium]
MYKALYRKYRPMTFDDVVSQSHITTTLRNQLIGGKTAHAYLFTGSRGTGKTTCARILAKALNCLHPVDGNPCLECEICRDAEENALSDIIEIDAASNNGVNDIRDLRDGAVYTAERCKYKVYIIDEVHMLSNEAFNALLKIMEEPPPHVKFILATTEIHKVLPTILSRCQRYDFRRILPKDITERLMYVAEKENISLDREAAELIAKTADGGMRDALSLLDQCIAFSENVTLDIVSGAAGIAGREPVFDIMEAVADKNAGKAAAVIDELYGMSKDMQKLCDELISRFRDVMMVKAVPNNADLLACMPSEIERIKALADRLTLEEIMRILEILQAGNERIARVSSKRVEIEMCLLKLCSQTPSQTAQSPSSDLTAKLDMLEQKLAAVQQNSFNNSTSNIGGNYQSARQKTAPPAQNQGGAPVKLNRENFVPEDRWTDILEKFAETCPSVSGTLNGSRAERSDADMVMVIFTKNTLFSKLLQNKENGKKMREAIKEITGKNYQVIEKCVAKPEDSENRLQGILDKARENGVPVE